MRSKIVALLVSLFALWAFAAYVTLQDGINLLNISTLDQRVGRPTDSLITALQAERHVSMVYLGSGRTSSQSELSAARAQTDQARAALIESTNGSQARFAASPTTEALVADLAARVAGLERTRSEIDAASTSRSAAAAVYSDTIDAGFLIFDSMSQFEDDDIAKQGRNLVAMTSARDFLSREDALLAGAIAAGSFSAGEPQEFAKIVGARRAAYEAIAARMPDADRAQYDELVGGSTFQQLEAYEDTVVDEGRDGAVVPVRGSDWQRVASGALTDLRDLELALTDSVLQRATPAAIWTMVRLALAGGLGLIAVIASIIISITTARALIRQLERLRNAAHELAAYRLPRVVERLQHGEKVDVDTEAPPLDFGRDEIGQVGEAFNAVQETAVRVAVEQAELRRSVRDVFLSLARRSQALLHRQLGLLDAMERRATDAEELAELFRIDHLATRMRRNAENLIVLSGATAGRAWRKPVPMVDVLRGALAEVEDYTRVTVVPVGSASLLGRAVGDVIHLLAELVENAVSFSPPQTVVRIGGSVVGNGFAIEIEDRGLGMTMEEREAANEQLRNPPEFKLTSTARLGLYVVGKLAERHGIRVRLTESPYGGTTAIVLLPSTLIADAGGDEVLRLDAGGGEPVPARPHPIAGRHRNDSPAFAGQTQTAVRGGPDLDMPLYSHVMQADLSTAVPTTAPPEPAVSATAVVDSFTVDDLPVRPVGAERGAQAPSPWSPPPTMPTPTPVVPPSTPTPTATPIPATAPNPAPTQPAPTVLTPSGLPWRQRPAPESAVAPAQSRTDPEPPPSAASDNGWSSGGSAAAEAPTPRPIRGLEESRNLMASYRSGTMRGRSEAARLAETNNHTPEWTQPTQESVGSEDGG